MKIYWRFKEEIIQPLSDNTLRFKASGGEVWNFTQMFYNWVSLLIMILHHDSSIKF